MHDQSSEQSARQLQLIHMIGEELNSECGTPADYDYWLQDQINDKQLIERLLPLCKLLNKLFFDHAPFET